MYYLTTLTSSELLLLLAWIAIPACLAGAVYFAVINIRSALARRRDRSKWGDISKLT